MGIINFPKEAVIMNQNVMDFSDFTTLTVWATVTGVLSYT